MKSHGLSAIVAGTTAGFAMLVWLMIGASYAGIAWDSPLRWISALLLSEPALIVAGQAIGGMSKPACLALGFAIHLATSIALAWLFLLFAPNVRGWRLMAAGLVFGIVIWGIMTFGVLRLVNDIMYARVQLLPSVFFGAHLVYGVVLAPIAARTMRSTKL
jgi:hypothetical protein